MKLNVDYFFYLCPENMSFIEKHKIWMSTIFWFLYDTL